MGDLPMMPISPGGFSRGAPGGFSRGDHIKLHGGFTHDDFIKPTVDLTVWTLSNSWWN